SLINIYGMDALENLLFNTTDDNSCSPSTNINSSGDWDNLVDSGNLAMRRADYSVVVATNVRVRSEQLRDLWNPAQGNFANQLATAGTGSNVYLSSQQGVNEVFAGLFYLDTGTKDDKVTIPLAGPNPDLRESRFANRSKEHLIANM